MTVKQAYEVYSLNGGGYNKRLVHGYAWTKEGADFVGSRVGTRYDVGVVHLIKVNARWHRLNVHPVEGVHGDLQTAETSRIETGDLPERKIPSIHLRVGNREPLRLPLNLEKAIDIVAGVHCTDPFTLYSYRAGGLLPITFFINELRNEEKTQRMIFEWLKTEIEIRL